MNGNVRSSRGASRSRTCLFLWNVKADLRGSRSLTGNVREPCILTMGWVPDDGLTKDTEAVLEGDAHADFPALLTKDVPGG